MPFHKILTPRIKTTLITLGDQAIYSGTVFLMGILVGRLLSIGDFGEFSLGLTLMVFSLILQDNLLTTPYSYTFHNTKNVDEKALRASALIQSQILAFFCMALLVVASFFVSTENGSLNNILRALGVSMPFLFLRETLRRIFFTEFKMSAVLIMDAGVSFLQIGAILMFWGMGWLTTIVVFPLIGAASALVSFLYLFLRRSEYALTQAHIKKDMRESFLYGRWLLLGSGCHLGSLYVFPWSVYALSGKVEAGAFAACYTLINLLNPLILGFNNYFRPKIMKLYRDEGVEAMQTLVKKILMFFLPFALGAVLFFGVAGGLLIRLIYGPEFAGLGLVIGIVGMSVAPVILNAPLQLGILAMNCPHFHPKFHGVSLAVALLVGIPLVLFYGKTGAAIGYSLSVSSGFAMLCWLYHHEVQRVRGAAS